jgi:hypothetical protein
MLPDATPLLMVKGNQLPLSIFTAAVTLLASTLLRTLCGTAKLLCTPSGSTCHSCFSLELKQPLNKLAHKRVVAKALAEKITVSP